MTTPTTPDQFTPTQRRLLKAKPPTAWEIANLKPRQVGDLREIEDRRQKGKLSDVEANRRAGLLLRVNISSCGNW